MAGKCTKCQAKLCVDTRVVDSILSYTLYNLCYIFALILDRQLFPHKASAALFSSGAIPWVSINVLRGASHSRIYHYALALHHHRPIKHLNLFAALLDFYKVF